MKKNWNSISRNMTLQCLMWKLGSFFFLPLIFTSASLLASETYLYAIPATEHFETDPSQKAVIYIAEGTVFHGLENIQNAEIKHFSNKRSERKRTSKKNIRITVINKITQKVKKQKTYNNPEISAHIYSNESRSSFNVSKHQFVVGALTFYHLFKAIPVHYNSAVFLESISSECAIHTYAFSFTQDMVDAHSFTRPPPSV